MYVCIMHKYPNSVSTNFLQKEKCMNSVLKIFFAVLLIREFGADLH